MGKKYIPPYSPPLEEIPISKFSVQAQAIIFSTKKPPNLEARWLTLFK
jgi:hypothetical protein